MVGNRPVDKTAQQSFDLAGALLSAYPELPRIVEAASGIPLYVVGGAIRDLFAGRGRTDLDLAVEGDPEPIVARLAGDRPISHDRFQTASVTVDDLRVDLARARSETYSRPGALPEVEPATIEEDLARRDFTVNAMAVRVGAEDEAWQLLDPFGGRGDLEAGVLRLLHTDSIRDDPTRALRGARYAAAYDLTPDPGTAAQLAATDLESVSLARLRADLERIAADPARAGAFALLEEWGVVKLREGWRQRLAAVESMLAAPPWQGEVELVEAVLAAVWPTPLREGEPRPPESDPGPQPAAPPQRPDTPAEIVAWAKSRRPLELLLARAEGASWLDDYMARLRYIGLEIDGADLIAAGLPQGPAIGRGLEAALRRKLNGEISGRESELATALAVARGGEG
jgi:tRNA nucleotidyltransferase (CCA-adding enzyme)